MKLIAKYLKPYILMILLIVGLTYVQVQTELALPDYMSDIVTNGIQFSGVNDNIPKSINQNDMETISYFLNDSDCQKVLNQYTLVNKGENGVIDNQEIEFKENVYLLNEDYLDISDIIKNPLVYKYICTQANVIVTKENKDFILKGIESYLNSVKDNYDNIVKLSIKDIYTNVGLSISIIQNNYILKIGLEMILVSLLSIVVTLCSSYLAVKISTEVGKKLRRDIFNKVESFSSSEFSKFSTSSLITRSGNDITKIQNLIQIMLRMMLMAPMMGITSVFKVMRYPSVAWILLVAIGIMLGLIGLLIAVAVPKFSKIQKLVDKINSHMREFLDGILVIRAFNSQKIEEDKFDETNSSLTKIDRFVNRMMNIISPVMTFIMNGLTIAILWYSSKQIEMDVMSVGDMMAFMQYAMHVVMSFMFVSMLFFMIPRSLVSAKRINEVLNVENTILDKENPESLPLENGDLIFDNVSFKYPNAEEEVLSNISFKVSPKETVAFIGSTGAGKSTIIKLIPRLFDVTSGKITYCGKDIRDISQKELHERIGYATQKAILFQGSIKENIEFGRDVNEDELNDAIKTSQSLNIISEKEEGVDYLITQAGTNVSGGQKQRISIARALAKKANIYIFDDTFSALDYETDKKLRKELKELISKTNASVLIVGQRIATIKDADKIIVLDNGKIVGMGKHFELLDSCKVYQEIAYSQLSKEELENARTNA